MRHVVQDNLQNDLEGANEKKSTLDRKVFSPLTTTHANKHPHETTDNTELHQVGAVAERDSRAHNRETVGRAARKPTVTEPQDDPVLNAEQVARMLGFTPWYVRQLCRRGQRVAKGTKEKGPYLVASKFAKEWRVKRSEVFKMLGRLEGVER